MTPGLRKHRQASLRVAIPALPEDMTPVTRELIDVKSDNQRKGHATALMHQVTLEADKQWMTLLIQVKPFADGMTVEQLKKWYGRFGFVEIQAEPCCLMARSPQRVTRIVRLN